MPKRLISLLIALLSPSALRAGEALEEVVVVARAAPLRVMQPVLEIDAETLARQVPATTAAIFQGVPSVSARTNSRGETVVRLRGAEERQIQVFLDGAPLAVPWDGRVDLGALPAGMIGGVRIVPGAAPIEYGANAVLGVVDMQSFSTRGAGVDFARLEAGTHGAASASIGGGQRGDGYEVLGAIGHVRRDALALSDRSAIPYAPVTGDRRENTDLESTSLFAAGGFERDWGAAKLSLLSVDSTIGVAPEGHLDPAADNPRYWRYPDWSFNQLTLNADIDAGDGWQWRTVGWYQDFAQQIDQFTSTDYQQREAREQDDDETFGARGVLERQADNWSGRLVASAQRSTHEQTDTDYTADGGADSARFRQDLASIGAEADLAWTERLGSSIGFSRDVARTPLTGGRAPQDDLSDWAGALAVRWNPRDEWEMVATIGRRTRFPTLRELYGEALGAFLPNPGLRPETAALADLTLRTQRPAWSLDLTAWSSHIEDTLARRTLRIDGTRYRQRYNQAGARGRGFEARALWQVAARVRIEAMAAAQDFKAEREPDGERPELYQRPDLQALLALDVQPAERWDVRIELDHTGEALDEGVDGEPVALPVSTQWHARIFYELSASAGDRWTLYAALENLTDELVLPQLGLPESGRTWRAGIRFER